MKTVAAILAALILTGCATSRPYTKGEKWALAGAFAGQILLDTGSTAYAVYETTNIKEANGTWGDLDDGELIATMACSKLALIGLAYLVGEWQPDLRTPMYSALGTIGATAGAWNVYQISKYGD